jgi:hypothetical protein
MGLGRLGLHTDPPLTQAGKLREHPDPESTEDLSGSRRAQISDASSSSRAYGIAVHDSARKAPIDREIIDTLAAASSSGAS